MPKRGPRSIYCKCYPVTCKQGETCPSCAKPRRVSHSTARKLRLKRTSLKKLLTPQQEAAAVMLASAEYSFTEIATKLNISYSTLRKWNRFNSAFIDRIEIERAIFREKCLTKGLAEKSTRLGVLNELHGKQMMVIRERSLDPAMRHIPGGSSGLLVRTYKGIGGGENFRLVSEYTADTALMKEIRGTMEDAALEMGHRKGEDIKPPVPPQININFVGGSKTPPVVVVEPESPQPGDDDDWQKVLKP